MIVLTPENRSEFMLHAYSALWNGNMRTFAPDVQNQVIVEVMADLSNYIRTLAPEDRDAYLLQFQQLVRVN